MNRTNVQLAQLGLGFFSLFGAVYFLKKLIKGQKENKRIKKENVYTVSSLIEQYKNLLKSNKKKIKICIKGELISKNPFRNHFDERKVIFSKLNKYNLYQNEAFFNDPISSLIKSNQYISLRDYFEKEKKIPILTDITEKLELISIKKKRDIISFKETNFFKSTLLFFWKMIMLIQSGIFGFNIFKGFNIGIRQSEFTVDLFTPVFIYGNIYINDNNAKFTIKSVKYMKQNLHEIQNLVNIKNFWYSFGFIFLSFGAWFFISLNFKSLYHKFKIYLKEKYNQRFLKKNLINEKKKDYLKTIHCSSPNCILCKKKSREILFKPCNDLLYCQDCYLRYKKINQIKNCPICNVKIKEVIKFHQG